jgi:hypothetical protein
VIQHLNRIKDKIMAGPKTRNTKNTTKKDYVGTYDGSKGKWTTRRVTDRDGNTRTLMAPVTSKPSEATKYNAGYSNASVRKNEAQASPKRGPNKNLKKKK